MTVGFLGVAPTREQLVQLTTDPVAFLTSDDPILRRMAATALAPSQALENIDTLATLTRNSDPSIRAAAAEKLGVCGWIVQRVP